MSIQKNGPLSGLIVVEMAGIGPVPLAGQLLCDLGARVIVVDRKSQSVAKNDVNRRGKQSIALNLKSKTGVEILKKLIVKADVLLDGFRPGVMERLSLSSKECLAANSRLIYTRLTGWGQEGPLAKTAGHDITYLAITGALHAMGSADRPPVPPINLVADYGGGTMLALVGTLSAIIERSISGKGQVVDAAMIDGVTSMFGLAYSMMANHMWKNEREANLFDGGAPFYRCYETSDHKYIAVGALESQFFTSLVEKLNLDKAFISQQQNREIWSEMATAFEMKFKEQPRDYWANVFSKCDSCVAPVLDWFEAQSFDHNKARSAYIDVGIDKQPAIAPRFSRNKLSAPKPAENHGASTENILSEIGISKAEMDLMGKEGVLS